MDSQRNGAGSLLVRGVAPETHAWLEAEAKKFGSRNRLMVKLLDAARAGTIEPTLYDAVAGESPMAPRPDAVPFTFVDLFAGIGGFRIGLTKLGGTCRFTCEWDKNAQRTYRRWFGEEAIAEDINDVRAEDIPDHDVLAAGFPCQPFSLAGVSKKNSLGQAHGFECEKQGNLFFRICDVIDVKRPPILMLENVKNLRSHDMGRTWAVIKYQLEKRNYRIFDQIIDAVHWVPQHRERVLIVGFDKGVFGPNPPYEPVAPPHSLSPRLGDILEPNPPAKYTLTDHLWNYLQRYAEKHRAKGNGFGFGLVGPNDVTRTLSARYYKDGSEILIRQGTGNPRRLTIREAARLMGYDDETARLFGHPDGFPQEVSDTQAYKQFGNSIVPAVVEAVGRQVLRIVRWHLDRSYGGCLLKRPAGRSPRARRAPQLQPA